MQSAFLLLSTILKVHSLLVSKYVVWCFVGGIWSNIIKWSIRCVFDAVHQSEYITSVPWK